MSYQSDIYTALAVSGAVFDIVATRVFPDVADGSAAAPYIVYQTISTSSTTLHDGGRDIEFANIQFSCWAKTRAAAIALGSALDGILDGNTIAGTSTATFTFSGVSSSYDSDSKLYGEIHEYTAHTNKN